MTIEELLEIEEIKKLRSLYSHYYDGAEVDKLANLFTQDAICEFGENYGGNWVGKERIHENYTKWIASEGIPHEVMHAVTNPNITLIDETHAHGRWYLLDLRTKVGVENPLILFGIYDDDYRKVFGQWKISRTRIDFLWPNRDVKADQQEAAE
ncbi:MAG: nuclear transport factor 2 family protein [Alphaproteobacteria bacterium]